MDNSDAIRRGFGQLKSFAFSIPCAVSNAFVHARRSLLLTQSPVTPASPRVTIGPSQQERNPKGDSKGRVLSKKEVIFAENTEDDAEKKQCFTLIPRAQTVGSDGQLAIIKVAGNPRNLIQTIIRAADFPIVTIYLPKGIINLSRHTPHFYMKVLKEAMQKWPNLRLSFVTRPNNIIDFYIHAKKNMALKNGMYSQRFLTKNGTRKSKMSFAMTVILVQTDAKLGDEKWSVTLPLKNTMFIGFYVFNALIKNGKETSGAMQTTFSLNFTKYYSTCIYQDTDDEIVWNMRAEINKYLVAYQEENHGVLPEKIFISRLGLGVNQLNQIYVELEQIQAELTEAYENLQQKLPSITYIIVSEKIHAKLFHWMGQFEPGTTVVDDEPQRYDSCFVSCASRIRPYSYNIPDQTQCISNKTCYMFFNCSDTVTSEPAFQLAFLTGLAYNVYACEQLRKKVLHVV